jgi:hypothetical protein
LNDFKHDLVHASSLFHLSVRNKRRVLRTFENFNPQSPIPNPCSPAPSPCSYGFAGGGRKVYVMCRLGNKTGGWHVHRLVRMGRVAEAVGPSLGAGLPGLPT